MDVRRIETFCFQAFGDRRGMVPADEECDDLTRAKIYAYVAACGLLWSNWCEFKAHLGVEFGEYSLRQYRYAKDYYKYAKELMEAAEAEK